MTLFVIYWISAIDIYDYKEAFCSTHTGALFETLWISGWSGFFTLFLWLCISLSLLHWMCQDVASEFLIKRERERELWQNIFIKLIIFKWVFLHIYKLYKRSRKTESFSWLLKWVYRTEKFTVIINISFIVSLCMYSVHLEDT